MDAYGWFWPEPVAHVTEIYTNPITVYGLLLIASTLFWQTWHDCIRISGLSSWHTLMPGHNGLFARQYPIAFTYFEYLVIDGFD